MTRTITIDPRDEDQRAAPHPMSAAALEVVQLEALRRRNYATAKCPTWHAVLTRMQAAAQARSEAAYVEFKAALVGRAA